MSAVVHVIKDEGSRYWREHLSAETSAILIAIAGVFGTLAAPIVSQRLSARAKRDEFEMQKSQRIDDRQQEQQQLDFTTKRSCYIAMIATSRRYRIELMNYLYKIKRQTVDDPARDELEGARRPYIASVAEAHLTAPLKVLSAIDPVTSGLSKGYRATKHLEDGEPEPDGSFEEIEAFLIQLWDKWLTMREAMRQDLGVED
jgi:hypothetical protein